MVHVVYWVGFVVTSLLIAYLLLFAIYKIMKFMNLIEVPPFILKESMPKMVPVPIPTKLQKTILRKLVVSIFKVRKWELAENWYFRLDEETEIVIPAGFRFDGASIPRLFWAFLSPVGLLLIPGLVHDYGYKYDQLWKVGANGCPEPYGKGKGKEFWDRLFEAVGEKVNDFPFIEKIAWLGVAIGGGAAWKLHRKTNLVATPPVLTTCPS